MFYANSMTQEEGTMSTYFIGALCEGVESRSWRFGLKKVKIAKQLKAGLSVGEGLADMTNVVFKGRPVELCTSEIIKNINCWWGKSFCVFFSYWLLNKLLTNEEAS